MKHSNRIMSFLLKSIFRINCPQCERHWLYEEYLHHQQRGLCRKDRTADNAISMLAAVARRPTIVRSGAAAEEIESLAAGIAA